MYQKKIKSVLDGFWFQSMFYCEENVSILSPIEGDAKIFYTKEYFAYLARSFIEI